MSAFAAAVGALFADPNIGRDAVYIADGGAPVLARGCCLLRKGARAVLRRVKPVLQRQHGYLRFNYVHTFSFRSQPISTTHPRYDTLIGRFDSGTDSAERRDGRKRSPEHDWI